MAGSLASADERLLRAIEGLGAIRHSADRPEELLQAVSEALARMFDWPFVALVTVDRERARFRCAALAARIPSSIYVGYSRPLGSGVVGRVAASGRSLLISDALAANDFVHTMPGCRAELAVPIFEGAEVIGVLNLESREISAFDRDQPLLEGIAEWIGPRIAAALRSADLNRHRRLLNFALELVETAYAQGQGPDVSRRLLELLAAQFRTEEATILLRSELLGHLEVKAHIGSSGHITRIGRLWPVALGVVGACYRQGSPLYAPDVQREPYYSTVNPRVRSELAIPVRIHEQVIGVINLESIDSDAFDALDRDVLAMLGRHLAGALWVERLQAELARTVARLERREAELQRARDGLGRALRRQRQALAAGSSSESWMPEAQVRRQLAALGQRYRRRQQPFWMALLEPLAAHSDEAGLRAAELCNALAHRDDAIDHVVRRTASGGVLLAGDPSLRSAALQWMAAPAPGGTCRWRGLHADIPAPLLGQLKFVHERLSAALAEVFSVQAFDCTQLLPRRRGRPPRAGAAHGDAVPVTTVREGRAADGTPV